MINLPIDDHDRRSLARQARLSAARRGKAGAHRSPLRVSRGGALGGAVRRSPAGGPQDRGARIVVLLPTRRRRKTAVDALLARAGATGWGNPSAAEAPKILRRTLKPRSHLADMSSMCVARGGAHDELPIDARGLAPFGCERSLPRAGRRYPGARLGGNRLRQRSAGALAGKARR